MRFVRGSKEKGEGGGAREGKQWKFRKGSKRKQEMKKTPGRGPVLLCTCFAEVHFNRSFREKFQIRTAPSNLEIAFLIQSLSEGRKPSFLERSEMPLSTRVRTILFPSPTRSLAALSVHIIHGTFSMIFPKFGSQ